MNKHEDSKIYWKLLQSNDMISYPNIIQDFVSLMLSKKIFDDCQVVIQKYLELFFPSIYNYLNQDHVNKINPNQISFPMAEVDRDLLCFLLFQYSKSLNSDFFPRQIKALRLILEIDPTKTKIKIYLVRLFQKRKMNRFALEILNDDTPIDLNQHNKNGVSVGLNTCNEDNNIKIDYKSLKHIFEEKFIQGIFSKLRRFYDLKFIKKIKTEFINLEKVLQFDEIQFYLQKIILNKKHEDFIEFLKMIFHVENYKIEFQNIFFDKINSNEENTQKMQNYPQINKSLVNSLFLSKPIYNSFKKQIKANNILKQFFSK